VKTHISLPASNLQRSVDFYQLLLDMQPTKHFSDYALFVSEDPGLELALNRGAASKSSRASHFGIVVDSVEAVEAAIERLQTAGLPIAVEREETCCYAKQTKLWASDPDDQRWEIYYVHEDTQNRNDPDMKCCSGDSGPACCAA